MDMALVVFNYSRICYVYSGINRGVNKKEGAILGHFDVYHMNSAITYRARFFF